jgi:hypothetical protein
MLRRQSWDVETTRPPHRGNQGAVTEAPGRSAPATQRSGAFVSRRSRWHLYLGLAVDDCLQTITAGRRLSAPAIHFMEHIAFFDDQLLREIWEADNDVAEQMSRGWRQIC